MGARTFPRIVVFSLVAALCLAGSASAFGTSPKKKSKSKASADSTVSEARAEAEKIYAEGWEISEQAKKDEKAGKTDSAAKKFCKARKKYEVAASVDSTYYQAWNMIGYCARHCGDLSASLNAYMKCLAINPDYEEMHEYLGELYIQMGDLEKARAQLAWLEERKSAEAKELAGKIEAAEKGTATPGGTKQGTSPPDSASGGKDW